MAIWGTGTTKLKVFKKTLIKRKHYSDLHGAQGSP
jgi:hypothetical protein